MLNTAARGFRLLCSDPRLFTLRLWTVLRYPRQMPAFLTEMHQARGAIQDAYLAWRAQRGDRVTGPGMPGPAVVSILMPVKDPDPAHLREAIESVLEQDSGQWQLCVADDASEREQVRDVLRQYATRDDRVRVVFREMPGHISEASNTALSLATAPFVLLLDHDDILARNAVSSIADVVDSYPDADFIYSDEDKLAPDGRHVEPFFKPDWSPTLLLSCNYVTHMAVMRRSLLHAVGAFRDDYVGSQDYDLFLRVGERARRVVHIPDVLYSWRMTPTSTAGGSRTKPYALDASRRSVESAVVRRRLNATVAPGRISGTHHINLHTSRLTVSLCLLGGGSRWEPLLLDPNISITEIVRIDPQVDPVPTSEVSGDYIVCLDASSAPARRNSLSALLQWLSSTDVVAAGGCSLARGRIQQAGLNVLEGGQIRPAFAGLPALPQPNFYLNLKDLTREVSAVYWGCCAMRREAWQDAMAKVGNLPAPFQVVHYCLLSVSQNKRVLYVPEALFYGRVKWTPERGRADWPGWEIRDPYWNPNLNSGSAYGIPFLFQREKEMETT